MRRFLAFAALCILVGGGSTASLAQELVLDVDVLRTARIFENRRNMGHMAPIALGDIDGDGYEDLVIGAPRAGGITTIDSGVVYVRWGGNYYERFPPAQDLGALHYDFTAPPDLVASPLTSAVVLEDRGGRIPSGIQINAERGGEAFGTAVAVGDFNGDGFGDIAISGPAPFGPPRLGAVYIVFGRADLGGNIDIDLAILNGDAIEIKGRTPGARFGEALLFADLNNDGYDDLIIGTPREGVGGIVDIVYGGPGIPSDPRTTIDAFPGPTTRILSDAPGERFGSALAAANLTPTSDSFVELLVGAPRWPEPSQGRGRAVAFKFNASQPTVVDLDLVFPFFYVEGQSNNSSVGTAIAVGDFLGNGAPDLVLGAPFETVSGSANAGRVYVVSNPAQYAGANVVVPTQANLTIEGGQPGEFFGTSLAVGPYDLSIGEDLIVGAPGFNVPPSSTNAGALFVYRTGTLPSGAVDRQEDGLPITRMQVRKENFRLGTNIALGKFYGLHNLDIFASGDGTFPFSPLCGSNDPVSWQQCTQTGQGIRIFGMLSGTLPEPPGGLSARQGWMGLE